MGEQTMDQTNDRPAPPQRLLEGKTVIVTGAGGGVGEGIALACATHGANVVVAARRTETGDPVAAEIVRRGGKAVSVRCDVASRADVDAAVAAAIEHFGGLDSMIHNALAPTGPPHGIEDVPDATWRSMIDTAVRASFHCAQAAFPQLRERKGTYILLTSAAGVEGSPYIPAYGLVKAAQRGLAKSLAREWGPLGIRVNCIGPVAMTPAMAVSAKSSPVFTDGLLMNRTPLRYIGEPEPDIGPVAVFLASELSRYVTGQTIIVDGGGFVL
jgi:NAD(P)-dependent dehydrogenase (short-subunit alcohol dehydrogenase family)